MSIRTSQGQHMLLAFFVVLLVLSGCARQAAPLQLAGATMGTSWHVTVSGAAGIDAQPLQADIETLLEQVNQSMSTYREDSEIVLFNGAPAGQWRPASREFIEVLQLAAAVNKASAGAYDVSVGPLVDLWGFGPRMDDTVPAQQAIAGLLELVGQQWLDIDADAGQLRKNVELQLDVSSIAKGYAVDKVAELLAARGLTDYMVEIGGEIRVQGVNPRQTDWQIAVERPSATGGAPLAVLSVSGVGVATSGSYRNFFEVDGVRYSHSIDPRSGWPVQHELVSVTVVHPSAALADAWATALTVLGPEQGLAVAEAEGLAAYLVTEQDGEWQVQKTPAFAPYLQ